MIIPGLGWTTLIFIFLLQYPNFVRFAAAKRNDDTSSNNNSQSCPSIVWSDEFDNRDELDLNKWNIDVGDGCDQGLCGWGNKELQVYDESHVSVDNGVLTLKVTAKYWDWDKRVHYNSGRINSRDKGDFDEMGRYEARMKIPTELGVWPGFWMLPTKNEFGDWPTTGEVDIMENIRYQPKSISSAVHFGRDYYHKKVTKHMTYLRKNAFFDDEFHRFAIEREPDVIRFLLDDVEYFRVSPEDLHPDKWPFENESLYFILNLAVPSYSKARPTKDSKYPQFMDIDYVRVYDKALPSIKGQEEIFIRNEYSYEIFNAKSDAVYMWKIPDHLQILPHGSGHYDQKGPKVNVYVRHNAKPGYAVIKCTVKSVACGDTTIELRLEIKNHHAWESIFLCAMLIFTLYVVVYRFLILFVFYPRFNYSWQPISDVADSKKIDNFENVIEFSSRR